MVVQKRRQSPVTVWLEVAIRIVLLALVAGTRAMSPTIQYIQVSDWHEYNYPTAQPEAIPLRKLIWYLLLGYLVAAVSAVIFRSWDAGGSTHRALVLESDLDDMESAIHHSIVPLAGSSSTSRGPAISPYGRTGGKRTSSKTNLVGSAYEWPRPGVPYPSIENVSPNNQVACQLGVWEMQVKLLQAVSLSFLASTLITCTTKNLVGRLRPDFLALCLPPKFDPAHPDFESLGFIPECGAPASFRLTDSRRSFPSGHASSSSSVFAVTALLLYAQLLRPNIVGAATRIMVSIAAFSPAVYVGLTRISDHRHHWSDVVVGLILGSCCARVAFDAYFPRMKSRPDVSSAVGDTRLLSSREVALTTNSANNSRRLLYESVEAGRENTVAATNDDDTHCGIV